VDRRALALPRAVVGRSGQSCISVQRIYVQALVFGGVIVNESPTFRADQMPYGGVKDSGNTNEGPRYAVRELTEERLIVIDLNNA
jgi:acyl-CoA reductase-like NAD-dependent aldehyde dehydrogenase